MIRLEIIAVAAGNDDVFELGLAGDIRESLFPAAGIRDEFELGNFLRVLTDRVAAGAKTAIDRTGILREKKGFVRVTMGQPGERCIFLLVQGIELEHRMIGQLLRAQRQELGADRVADRIGPVDQREEIGGNSQGHWSGLDPCGEILVEALGNEGAKRVAKLARIANGEALLKKVGTKLFAGDLREAGQAAPE